MKSPPPTIVEARIRLRSAQRPVFGPGKVELLGQIEKTGSISEAAKSMDMSYMRAWSLVQAMNEEWREPLVEVSRGGRSRGGAKLTDTGREVVRLYQEIVATSERATRALARQLTALR